jgi:putative salt-induced outer membrane protein YdiY
MLQKQTAKRLLTVFAGLAALWIPIQADVVETADGARLTGRIVKIVDGQLTLDTSYAGKIVIDLSQVSSFSTNEPVSLRVDTGDVLVGPVTRRPDGSLEVATAGGPVRTTASAVEASWSPGERDPAAVAREAELAAQLRRWTYRAGVDISGRSGNTDRLATALSFNARLEGPNDRLDFYASYMYAEDSNVQTDHQVIGGMSFTNFFSGNIGWYVRQELEYNEPEGIDLRSTSAAGLTYRWINQPRQRLETRAGLSFRHESYATDTSESFAGLEFGASHFWRFADWGEVNTELTYLPSFDDFGTYLFIHDSGVDMPLGLSDRWRLRFGLNNRYNSEPEPGRRSMDTTYYVRLLLLWQ